MTSNEYTIHYKTSLLEYAYKFNVSSACRAFHISRTRYYEIANDFLKYGKAGYALNCAEFNWRVLILLLYLLIPQAAKTD